MNYFKKLLFRRAYSEERYGGANQERLVLALALQGGGSFGAFAWGAIERLMERPGLEFETIVGASAGAVNAVLLASGLLEGGPDAARAKLEAFWRRMSQSAAFLPSPRVSTSSLGNGLNLLRQAFTPYQFNPFNLNPLRDALEALVDFEALRRSSPIQLHIAATRVRDGASHIFRNEALSVDAVLASACLPLLHHTVEIDGEAYWDGGYTANPPLLPAAMESKADRLLVVQLTPHVSGGAPVSSSQIMKRLDEIRFNAALNRELEFLKWAKLHSSDLRLRRLRIGLISAGAEVSGLEAESAARLDWSFVDKLRRGGWKAADAWLAETGLVAGASSVSSDDSSRQRA